MIPNPTLAILAIVSALWGSISAVRIGAELQRRGYRVNWLLMKLYVFSWVSVYKQLTSAERGRPGPLYWHFIIGMNGALVLMVLAFLLH